MNLIAIKHTYLCLLIFCTVAFPAFTANGQSGIFVAGQVTNDHAEPIAGASVSLLNTNENTVTDATGVFNFLNLAPGKYTIRITSVGYSSLAEDLDVAKESANRFQFVLHDQGNRLDEVVVTAEKKEERLQQIPLSVTALTAKEVNDYRLWDAKDLTAIVPNLYSSNAGDGRNVSFIRGVGTTAYEPAVATYIDGVNQFSLDTYIPQLFDIERIEVLRGPQGTLYGRNAMGGVINIITREPNDKVNVFGNLSFGNYNQQRYQAGISTPLVKRKLYLGVAAMFNKRNGFYTNTFLNKSFDKQHAFLGNYYLKYRPAEKWMLSLNVKNEINRNDGGFALNSSLDEALEHPFEIQQNAAGKMIDNTLLGSVGINYTGDKLNFSSQTTWQSNYRIYDNPVDGDFSPLDAVTITQKYPKPWNKVRTWTQEFKLMTRNSAALQWTTGIYLYSDKHPNKTGTHYGADAWILGASQTDVTAINTSTISSNGMALYGQATYPVAKNLSTTLGLRYDYEHMNYQLRGEFQEDGQQPIITLPDTSAATHYGAFSPKIGLSYKLSAGSNLYITYARGFRTGGMTQLSEDPSKQPPLFKYAPEYSNNVEIGWKNSFFNQKLYANLAVFFTNITNVQVPTLILPEAITIIRNAGKLNSRGAEIEVSAAPLRGLHISYNTGVTDAKYKSLQLSKGGAIVNLADKKQIFTPDMTSVLAIQYSYKLKKSSETRLVVRGEWFYLGKQYFDLVNSISQDAYSLLNTRFGVAFKEYELMFWGRNLTNKKYVSYAYDFGAVHLGDPVTYGITLGVKI